MANASISTNPPKNNYEYRLFGAQSTMEAARKIVRKWKADQPDFSYYIQPYGLDGAHKIVAVQH